MIAAADIKVKCILQSNVLGVLPGDTSIPGAWKYHCTTAFQENSRLLLISQDIQEMEAVVPGCQKITHFKGC